MTDPADATLATLRATIRRLALPTSFALQPVPDWDALIAEQDAWQDAHPEPTHLPGGMTPCLTIADMDDAELRSMGFPPPTAATAMPARALHHTRRTGWEQLR